MSSEREDSLWHLRQAREKINQVKDELVKHAPQAAKEVICSLWGARVRTGWSRAVRFDNPCCRGYHIVQPCSCLLSPCHLPCFIGTIAYAVGCKTESAEANRVFQISISIFPCVHWFFEFSFYHLWFGSIYFVLAYVSQHDARLMKRDLGKPPKTKKDKNNKPREYDPSYGTWWCGNDPAQAAAAWPETCSAEATAAAKDLEYRDHMMNPYSSSSPSTELWPAGFQIRPSRCPTPPPKPSRSWPWVAGCSG